MAITDYQSEVVVSYTAEVVYLLLFGDEFSRAGFTVSIIEDNLRTIHFKTKTSLFSFGEKVSVSIQEIDSNKSKISILSHPKTGIMFGGLFDFGKNRNNIRKVMEILDESLSYCGDNSHSVPTSQVDKIDEVDQLLKFHELKIAGIISQDEFDKKKKQLLNR